MPDQTMPVLFIGHGSPMNAVADNSYTSDLNKLSKVLPKPKAILVISAHWQTGGTRVTSGPHPEQIYDFYGFPDELYRIRYPAPGFPEAANWIVEAGGGRISPDTNRGIDHAAWAVLIHLFPNADVPVLELSLDLNVNPEAYFQLGQKLKKLRRRNILVIGSGNIVHNLGMIAWEENAKPFDRAVRFDETVKVALIRRDDSSLIDYRKMKDFRLAVPTNEHYLPMLYSIAMRERDDELTFVHESLQNASVSMRCFLISRRL